MQRRKFKAGFEREALRLATPSGAPRVRAAWGLRRNAVMFSKWVRETVSGQSDTPWQGTQDREASGGQTEHCGRAEHHKYELHLAINDIEPIETKVQHPQTNGVHERFRKSVPQELHQFAFRTRNLYVSFKEPRTDLDAWIDYVNTGRTHEGRMSCGSTPIATMLAGKEIYDQKMATLDKSDIPDMTKWVTVRSSRDYCAFILPISRPPSIPHPCLLCPSPFLSRTCT
ncbi:MAG: hypothetical protein ACT4PQ_07660 [Betaproteobacteria bacterium]